MGSQVHRFGNLIFDLDLYMGSDGHQKALDRARDLYLQQVLPRIEEVLDELVPPDILVEMDSLSIDLGDIGHENWEAEFVEQCVVKFATKLREKLAGKAGTGFEGGGIKVSAPAVWQPRQLIRYLETGSYGVAAPSLPPPAELLSEWLDREPEAILQALADSTELRNMARRLVYHFPWVLVERLQRLILAELGTSSPMPGWKEAVRSLALKVGFSGNAVQRGLRVTEVWHLLEAWSHRLGRGHFHLVPAIQLLQSLGIAEAQSLKDKIDREPGGVLDWILRFLTELKPELQQMKPPRRKKQDTASVPMEVLQAWEEVWEAIQGRADHSSASVPTKGRKDPEITAELLSTKRLGDKDSIPVALAGIVLLNPFIQGFFEHLGLVKEGEFVHESAQYRAVYLLNYLATYSTEVDEGELLLPKLLCGLPLTAPIFLDEPVTNEEHEAANELLRAVIDYWPSMEGSAPEALQEAFLCRRGTLEQGGTGFRLRVESFVLDVLLAKLPWGLSIVHYPWMEGLLYVEWS